MDLIWIGLAVVIGAIVIVNLVAGARAVVLIMRDEQRMKRKRLGRATVDDVLHDD